MSQLTAVSNAMIIFFLSSEYWNMLQVVLMNQRSWQEGLWIWVVLTNQYFLVVRSALLGVLICAVLLSRFRLCVMRVGLCCCRGSGCVWWEWGCVAGCGRPQAGTVKSGPSCLVAAWWVTPFYILIMLCSSSTSARALSLHTGTSMNTKVSLNCCFMHCIVTWGLRSTMIRSLHSSIHSPWQAGAFVCHGMNLSVICVLPLNGVWCLLFQLACWSRDGHVLLFVMTRICQWFVYSLWTVCGACCFSRHAGAVMGRCYSSQWRGTLFCTPSSSAQATRGCSIQGSARGQGAAGPALPPLSPISLKWPCPHRMGRKSSKCPSLWSPLPHECL